MGTDRQRNKSNVRKVHAIFSILQSFLVIDGLNKIENLRKMRNIERFRKTKGISRIFSGIKQRKSKLLNRERQVFQEWGKRVEEGSFKIPVS